ncbi:hypothetical protein [Thermophagus xiamenensis]|uniref:Nodulation protein Z (NodZ) n=1 Tax=Thermophagus xiamenensis TaxID=385682 RepID=A0A1I2ETG0_9BACT|nr:hypothetical protein [Thermophagus xiamenensis]SFE96362.1 Nodulation protein Z (NodZ) [Thermophagus xiamenensis]
MKNRYLILKGCAGLGNRLITLSNTIDYARKTKRTLFVDWSDGQFGKKFDNVFYKYFRLINIPHIQSLEVIKGYNNLTFYPPLWGKMPEKSLYDLYVQAGSDKLKRLLPFSLKGAISKKDGYWLQKTSLTTNSNKDLQTIKSLFKKNDIPYGGRYKTGIKEDVVFYADFCPPLKKEYLRNNLDLSNELAEEIGLLKNQLKINQKTIGVHVRMTDKQPDSSLDSLKKIINDLKTKSSNIFLATDNKMVEDYFLKNFKNVVFTSKWRPEDYGQKMGIHQFAIRHEKYDHAETILKESIIDMWLLAHCEFLIYQKNSSFSKISAIIKNEPEKTFSW